MKTKYWKVVADADEWPGVQSKGSDEPLILFSNRTVTGQRSAVRWAEIICDWMNEQMRLGLSTEKRRQCDPMLMRENRKLTEELKALNLENQRIHSRMMKLEMALQSVRSAIGEHHAALAGEEAAKRAGEGPK